MSDGRDPLLESIFAQSDADRGIESINGSFELRVMNAVKQRRRNVVFGRMAIVGLIVLLEVLLSSPLQSSMGAFTGAISASIFDIGDGWLGLILSPINSVAGVIGVLLLGLHALYRRRVR